ncbi:fimbrillin family protein [Bacteroides sp. 51]|uniref:fimbrillin family protein n=1 Tax=Bacteroides sp. 51 TaxID=2302938 RepID=UPI0013D61F34|nr:fimbrillin family protein [Bacteroides sp. 51]NDV82125.1 fimbrillin family protein [Bacteroides sp. 51]
MRFKHTIFATLSFLMAMFAACDSDDDKSDPDLQPDYLTFEGTIIGKEQGEGESPLWPVNNIIGLYATNADEKAILSDYQNLRYITEKGDGKFAPGNKYTDVIYYPEDIHNVQFISYSPYRTEMTSGVYKVDLTQQSNQHNLDLMYAESTQTKPADNLIKLDFGHELSKVVFNIKAGKGLSALTNLKVTVTNLKAKADYRLLDRSFKEEETVTDIVMKTTAVDGGAISEGIILPTEAAERKFVFRVVIGNDTKTFEINASEEVFPRGKKQTFDITLERNEVILDAKSTIEDWGLGSSETIIIDPTKPTGEGGGEIEYVTKEFFAETFGTGAANIKLDEYTGFDMSSPVVYSNGVVRLDLQLQPDRFPDNGYFLTMLQHNGTPASEKTLIIDNIPSEGYQDMVLSYDYAAGNVDMKFGDLTLKCNGVEVALPDQKIKNRDRFEGVNVNIPQGTTKIEFVQDRATLSYLRLDNIKIKGKTAKENK